MEHPRRRSGRTTVDCAAALIISEGRILLGLHAPDSESYPSVWDVFGGHVEGGETIEEALVRELREELDVTPLKFAFVVTVPEPDPQANGNCLYHFYKVTGWSGAGPRLCNREHTEIRWYSLDEAMTLNLASPEYRALFRKILAS